MSEQETGRLALEAATDQALAVARDNRHAPGLGDFAPVVDWLVRVIREQFPGDQVLAGRVLMAAAQFTSAAAMDAPHLDTAIVGAALAFAAEQVVREAAERSAS